MRITHHLELQKVPTDYGFQVPNSMRRRTRPNFGLKEPQSIRRRRGLGQMKILASDRNPRSSKCVSGAINLFNFDKPKPCGHPVQPQHWISLLCMSKMPLQNVFL
jgi:hypothetical protein